MEKRTTTIVVSGWIAVLRLFMNIDWSNIDLSRTGIYGKLTQFGPNPDTTFH